MPLSRLRQEDFSAGMWRSLAPHRIPANGCFDLLNYLLDNQGLPYQRGGIEAFSSAASSSDFTNVYDRLLEGGQRTFWSTKTEIGVLDGTTPITLEPPGFFAGIPTPRRGTVIGGRLYIDGGLVYAGTLHPGEYSTGTVATTQGSTTVVGTGTAWLSNVGAGQMFNLGPRNYVIASVTDDTHLELTQKFKEASESSHIYQIQAIGAPKVLSDIYGTAGRRLLAVGGRSAGTRASQVLFSRNQDPINEIVRTDNSFEGIETLPDEDPENFHEGDYHEIPHGPNILGLASWGDTAVVFTTDGVWSITNMDLNPLDDAGNAQEQLVHSAPQVVLWHRNGVASFEDALIVPARDGIYIMGAGSLERIDQPITPLYRDYVRQGLTLGVAKVVEGHYFLPVLSGTDEVDTLVCRVDRPVGRERIRPWSHFNGLPIRAFETKVMDDSTTGLLIASTGNQILRARYFEPDAYDSRDNGSVFTSQIISRDFPTGDGNKNAVREIDVDYDLVDSADSNPTLIGDFATTHPAETASYTSAGDNGPEGTDQFQRWLLSDPPRTRYIRVRLRSTGRLQKLLIRSIAILVRQSTKNE